MTKIVFDGAEKPSHRILLEGMGVKRMSLSFWRLRQRGLPKKGYRISTYFDPEVEVYVDSGWMQANEHLASMDELFDYRQEYEQFVTENLDRIVWFTQFRSDVLTDSWLDQEWQDQHPFLAEKMVPVWDKQDGARRLVDLAQRYPNIALTHEAAEDPVVQPRIGALSRQFGVTFHALNTAIPNTLRGVPLGTASTLSWASPQMRGETIVWDGTRLVRYQARLKDKARSRYKAVAETAGLDFEKILADDPKEVTRLAIWSYQQLEMSMDKNQNRPHLHVVDDGEEPLDVTDRAETHSDENAETEGGIVATKPSETRNSILPRESSRDPSERTLLPVFGVETHQIVEMQDGHQVIRDVPVLRSAGTSLRQCNTCVLSANCPAFKPDADCAFSLPVEVRTKEQLRALLNATIEIQGQRVAFAKFAEDLNGGYPDPNLSQEIDRLFKLVKTLKELESNNEFVRMTVERQTSGGLMSALFGDRARELNKIEPPLNGDEVIKQIFED